MLYLRYLAEFDNYGIEKSAVAQAGPTPEIKISAEDCLKLSDTPANKAKIGFLLGQDKSADGTEFYTIDKDYLTTLLKAGADLQFIDYDNAYAQTKQVSGLVLPGGTFDSPQNFYIKPNEAPASKRAFAYVQCAMAAEQDHKPILGICAGAQMLGALHGRKMYASIKSETRTHTMHKSTKDNAHQISIFSPLQKIMQTDLEEMSVNSRHSEAMLEDMFQQCFAHTDMQLYAVSKEDNLPEAWGNEEKNILCIQWHPENLAAHGQQPMQNIYNWVVDKAAEYASQPKLKIKFPVSRERA